MEKKIERFVGYITLSVVLLLLGLLMRDQGGMRGFPFGWLIYPDKVDLAMLLASFAALLAVTVCAGLISAAIGRAKEPAMEEPKEKTKTDIIAKTVVVPAQKETASKRKTLVTDSVRKEIKRAEVKPSVKSIVKADPNSGNSISGKIVAIAIVALVSLVTFFGTIDDDDYDTDYNDDTYDYEMSDEYSLKDIADNIMYSVTWGDYEPLSEAGDTKPVEEFVDLSDYEVELLNDTNYVTDDNEHAVFKYILYEDSGNKNATVCLAGLLIGGDVSEDFPTDTKLEGFTIYKFGSYDEFKKFYNSEEGEISIDKDKCVSIGTVEADDTFILNMH